MLGLKNLRAKTHTHRQKQSLSKTHKMCFWSFCVDTGAGADLWALMQKPLNAPEYAFSCSSPIPLFLFPVPRRPFGLAPLTPSHTTSSPKITLLSFRRASCPGWSDISRALLSLPRSRTLSGFRRYISKTPPSLSAPEIFWSYNIIV